ncbi:MAG: YHS domain-containing (seleno)protein [Opitutales bacterium]
MNPDSVKEAISGYDPVAYHTEGKALEGKAEHTLLWDKKRWYFVSAANRARFDKDPQRYAPQYGGHCACAVAMGHRLPGDPRIFRIEDGKLYFFHTKDMRSLWDNHQPEFRRKARKNHVSLFSVDF